jgi:hypothetical protein
MLEFTTSNIQGRYPYSLKVGGAFASALLSAIIPPLWSLRGDQRPWKTKVGMGLEEMVEASKVGDKVLVSVKHRRQRHLFPLNPC